MRVAIVLFNLSNIGGIVTWVDQLSIGFRQIGIRADIIYLTRAGMMQGVSKVDGRLVDIRYGLGYNKNAIKRYRKIINKYDMVIFAVACPHQNKANINNVDWMDCYRKIHKDKIVISVVHDQYWDSDRYGYRWLTEVKDCIDYVVAVKEIDYKSIKNFPGRVKLIHWPLCMDDIGKFKKKENLIISMSQFRPWKWVWHLLKIAPYIDSKIEFYNRGINYYQFKRGDYYGDIRDKYWERAMSNNSKYGGYLTDYKDCIKVYKRAIAVIDFSYRRLFPGIYNYTSTEGMKYGCVPIMYPQVLSGGFITNKEAYIVDMVRDGKKGIKVAKQINRFLKDRDLQERYVNHNMKFVKKHFCSKKIAGKFMDLCEDSG